MKLEPKHIVPYLSNHLKVKIKNDTNVIFNLNGYNNETDIIKYSKHLWYESETKLENCIPILRSLSEIEDEEMSPEYLLGCCYAYVDSLIKQNYDVFGLIPKGLAIDEKSLKKSSFCSKKQDK